MFYIDPLYIILVVPAIIFSMWASNKVNSTYRKYSTYHSKNGVTANEVCRKILDSNGLDHIEVGHIKGNLTDHYDPKNNIIRLSDSVYNSTSVAAIGVAAHEAGHAIQHAKGYAPLKLRNAVIPISQLGSALSMPLIILGIIVSNQTLANLGIIAFMLAVLFQVFTLPTEFDASNRALTILGTSGYLTDDELYGSEKVLKAAAMTYVASLAVALTQLLRLIILFGGRRDD